MCLLNSGKCTGAYWSRETFVSHKEWLTFSVWCAVIMSISQVGSSALLLFSQGTTLLLLLQLSKVMIGLMKDHPLLTDWLKIFGSIFRVSSSTWCFALENKWFLCPWLYFRVSRLKRLSWGAFWCPTSNLLFMLCSQTKHWAFSLFKTWPRLFCLTPVRQECITPGCASSSRVTRTVADLSVGHWQYVAKDPLWLQECEMTLEAREKKLTCLTRSLWHQGTQKMKFNNN